MSEIPTLLPVEHLVGPHEVAQLLGVSRQRVHQLSETKGFPAPVVTLKACKVWATDDIRAWATATGRQVHED